MRQTGDRSTDVRDGQGMGGPVSSTMRHHHDSQKHVDTDSYPHNSTNANDTSTPTKTSSSSATPGIQLETIAITIHGMFDLPPQISSLNADTCTLELVLKSNVRYYRDGNRLTTLPLPAAYLPFSPADITNKHDRLCVGFAKDETSVTLFSCEANQHATARTTIAPDITTHPMECGKLFVHPDNLTVAKDGRFLLHFPIYPDIKAVFEVFVGARARYHHSYTGYTWMTAARRGLMELRKTSFFSFSDGEVHRQKVIHRLVETSVGRLLVSVSLPHCLDNLPETEPDCEALQVHICAAARRLLHDTYRFNVLYPGVHATKMLEYVAHTNYGLGFLDRLRRGESEYSIYNDLLWRACPDYYVRRVERIIETYPPTSSTDSWLQGLSAGQLVAAHKGKELDLVRMVCVMLGPEPCCVGPRERMRAFALATALEPEHIHLADTCKLPDRILSVCNEDDLSDYEPEYYFDHLEKTLKTKERLPIEYNVCPVEVAKDERLYFSDALRFPVNSPEGRFRDQTLAARQRRTPLQLTPYERPLEPPSGESHSHQVNEIDILQNKYKVEFAQIIPSFADTMDAVVRQHEGLLSRRHTNLSKGNDFARFYSSHPCEPYSLLLTRLAEYTYISPSSLIACFVYMDHLLRRYPDLHLTRHNIERLVVTCLRIASKVVDLRSINNRNFAHIFRLQSSDINVIEEQLVNLMNFEFFLSPMEHYHYVLRMDFAPTTPWWLRAGANSQLSRMMSAMSLDYSSRGAGKEDSGQDGSSPCPMSPRGPGVKTPLIPIMDIPSTTAVTTAKGVAAICVPQSNEVSTNSLNNETRASGNGHSVPSRRPESVSERTAAANPAVGIMPPRQNVFAGGTTVKSSDAKKASSGDAVPRGGGPHTALGNPKVVAKRASLAFSRKPQSRGQSTSSSANGNVSVQ